MKKTKIKRFFKLFLQGEDAYPKLCKLLQRIGALLFAISIGLLSFFGLNFLRSDAKKSDVRPHEESVFFMRSFFNFKAPISIPFFSRIRTAF